MEKYTTSDRLKQLMESRGLKQADIIRAVQPYCKKYGVKFGKSILSQYIAGRVEPRQVKLSILGQALGVSEAWLMGYDVPMERRAIPVVEDDKQISKFVELFKLLTPEQQSLIISQIKGILLSQHTDTTEKTYQIKKVARNGDFEEKTITESELNAIKNLPDVDDF